MKTIIVVLAVAAYVLGLVLLSGYVFRDMWGWFIVPLGLPALSLPHAIGIALAVRFLTHTSRFEGDQKDVARDKLVEKAAGHVIYLLAAWAIAAIVAGYL